MSKYFTDEKEKVILLSSYTGDEKNLLIAALGDQYLPKSIIDTLSSFYHSYGGRYSVRSDDETIRGVVDIYRKFPRLSKKAISEIGFVYIQDLFERYELDIVLTGLLKFFGETDDAFEIFLSVVSKKADELDEEYKRKAEKLDLYQGYSKAYIDYLKSLVMREHVDVDKIMESIPSKELIQRDEKQLEDLSRRSKIYFGCCYPISYQLTRMHAKGEDISKIPELKYYISTTKEEVPATFTKEDYLKEVKQEIKRK